MKQQIVWKITSISDKNEHLIDTETTRDRMRPRYLLYSAVAGRSAMLINLDDRKQSLQTSRIEELIIFGDRIKITTLNSVYWLKQSIEDVE
ncbi:hypothetical protein pW2_52 [Bacillus phage pW2]|uniref:Uncharacterized protein n=1 Tax=Bacillus phage pW2 TaxID=2500559 RepID=A0A3T0IHK1_9CAUD|nr:hypothetical protein PQE69_gp037 [Bacillus phage pW2]AZU98890.1 hypothetical protein pW2_52 [Bacillus phage pW2]